MADDIEKLFIHHDYDNVESGPAEVVGTEGDAVLLRLLFIPFMYATPTYGDVVAATREAEFEDNLAFACPGQFGMDVEDLHRHGGRYALIFDFELAEGEGEQWFQESHDIMSSLAWPQEEGKPGRAYLAVQDARTPDEVMRLLKKRHPNSAFTLIHPEE